MLRNVFLQNVYNDKSNQNKTCLRKPLTAHISQKICIKMACLKETGGRAAACELIEMTFMKQLTRTIKNVPFLLGDKFGTGCGFNKI